MSEAKNAVNLVYLYPDILNLHGDRGNVWAFEKAAREMGIPLNVIRVDSPNEKLNFEEYDIVLLSPGELKAMKTLEESLHSYRDDIVQFIAEKKFLFALGTTGALLAKEVKKANGETFAGLGLLDMHVTERNRIYGDDLIVSADGMELVGCQIQTMDSEFSYVDCQPFGSIAYGYGNNGSKNEGARKDNLIFTNMLGPLLVKNPWLAQSVLLNCAQRKNIDVPIKDLDFDLEKKSNQRIKEFAEKKAPVTKGV